jgi:hypothetical protein
MLDLLSLARVRALVRAMIMPFERWCPKGEGKTQ